MSKLQRKIQFCAEKGVYVFRYPVIPENGNFPNTWAVHVEGAFSPIFNLTKRQAVNIAYSAAIDKKVKLKVTFDLENT